MGNGQVERLNRTFRTMLTTLQEYEKRSWSKDVPKLAFSYNSTRNKTTSYSHFFLTFGRKSILPIHGGHAIQGMQNESHQQLDWSCAMREAFQIVGKHINKATIYNKKYYDKRVTMC